MHATEERLKSRGCFLEKLKLELIPKVPKSTVRKQAENGAGGGQNILGREIVFIKVGGKRKHTLALSTARMNRVQGEGVRKWA